MSRKQKGREGRRYNPADPNDWKIVQSLLEEVEDDIDGDFDPYSDEEFYSMLNSNNKTENRQRSHFLKNLAHDLSDDYLRVRSQCSSLPVTLKRDISNLHGNTNEPELLPTQDVPSTKRKRISNGWPVYFIVYEFFFSHVHGIDLISYRVQHILALFEAVERIPLVLYRVIESDEEGAPYDEEECPSESYGEGFEEDPVARSYFIENCLTYTTVDVLCLACTGGGTFGRGWCPCELTLNLTHSGLGTWRAGEGNAICAEVWQPVVVEMGKCPMTSYESYPLRDSSDCYIEEWFSIVTLGVIRDLHLLVSVTEFRDLNLSPSFQRTGKVVQSLHRNEASDSGPLSLTKDISSSEREMYFVSSLQSLRFLDNSSSCVMHVAFN
ncbi:hypothetical protein C0J52_25058 [Blattella germanica]|nr:hypothetical protein C0J52_25058 [Blattella germanica]